MTVSHKEAMRDPGWAGSTATCQPEASPLPHGHCQPQGSLKPDGTPTDQVASSWPSTAGENQSGSTVPSPLFCASERQGLQVLWQLDQLLGKHRCPGEASGRKLGLFRGLG